MDFPKPLISRSTVGSSFLFHQLHNRHRACFTSAQSTVLLQFIFSSLAELCPASVAFGSTARQTDPRPSPLTPRPSARARITKATRCCRGIANQESCPKPIRLRRGQSFSLGDMLIYANLLSLCPLLPLPLHRFPSLFRCFRGDRMVAMHACSRQIQIWTRAAYRCSVFARRDWGWWERNGESEDGVSEGVKEHKMYSLCLKKKKQCLKVSIRVCIVVWWTEL